MAESNADKGTLLHRIGLSGIPHWFYMADRSVHHGRIQEIDTAGFFTLSGSTDGVFNSAQVVRVAQRKHSVTMNAVVKSVDGKEARHG